MYHNQTNLLLYILNDYWYEERDPRTKHLLMIQIPPYLVPWYILTYIILSSKVGPALMKNSEPYVLREVMLLYNTLMTIINAVAFVMAIYYSDYGRRILDFEYPSKTDVSERTMLEIHLGYLYWLTKFLDLLDTLFFVLRKRSRQITFLHLYHHAVVPLFGWLFFTINPRIPAVHLFAIINSLIHIIMYSYYALAAFGPNVRKYLWWKKYITQMQMGQFMIGGCYGAIMFFFQKGYPQIWLWIGMTQPPLFFWMFYDFYRKAYENDERKERKNSIINNKNNNNKKII